jgi:hypothetical protein
MAAAVSPWYMAGRDVHWGLHGVSKQTQGTFVMLLVHCMELPGSTIFSGF